MYILYTGYTRLIDMHTNKAWTACVISFPGVDVRMSFFCPGSIVLDIGSRIRGSMDSWIHESMHPWIHGVHGIHVYMDPWSHGSMNHGSMNAGSMGPWIHGFMDTWIPWVHGSYGTLHPGPGSRVLDHGPWIMDLGSISRIQGTYVI